MFLTFSVLLGQNELTLTKRNAKVVDFNIEVYEDKTSSLTLDEIKNVKNFSLSHNRISLGYTKSAFWFRFKIKNISDEKLDYVLVSTELIADKLDCYVVSKDSTVKEYKSGLGYLNKDSLVINSIHKYPISLEAYEEKEVYLREVSLYPLYTSLLIFNRNQLNEYVLSYEKIMSLYFGGLLALILYNFFLYFSTRDRSYFLYIMYVSSFMIWQLSLNGFIPFQTYTKVSYAYINGLFVPLFIAFLFLFSREILDTKKMFPKIDQLMKYIAYMFFVLAILTQIELYNSYIVLNYAATITFPILLYIGFKSYFAGNKVAIYFIMAQGVFLALSTIYSLMTEGYIEYTLLSRHGIVVGSFIEIVLFSLALGYRLRILQDEKIYLSNKANIELDEKVQERTKELREYQSNLEDKVEEELKKSRDKDKMIFQQNKLVSMGEMIENIAHQWRQPLSQINSAVLIIDAEISESDTRANAIVVDKLNEIEKLTKYMSGTIDDFRYFFDNNKEKERFSIGDGVHNSISILKGSLKHNKIEVELDIDTDITIDGYINELQQVVLILLNNSKDEFIADNKENAKISISVKRLTKYIEIVVCDNAGGIATDIIDKIFEPYFTTKFKSKGTGLGLNIAKIIVEEHFNGKLSVANKGDGACFKIVLACNVN